MCVFNKKRHDDKKNITKHVPLAVLPGQINKFQYSSTLYRLIPCVRLSFPLSLFAFVRVVTRFFVLITTQLSRFCSLSSFSIIHTQLDADVRMIFGFFSSSSIYFVHTKFVKCEREEEKKSSLVTYVVAAVLLFHPFSFARNWRDSVNTK